MSSSPSPRFAPSYEPSFDTHRAGLGLSGANFDHFFREVEFYVCDDPWMQFTEEVPDSDGIRMLSTRQAFPDIPPLYVYYRFEPEAGRVVFFGLSPAWSQVDTF